MGSCKCVCALQVVKEHDYSKAADVYSFGIIMWEMMTWRLPWEELNPFQVTPCPLTGLLALPCPVPPALSSYPALLPCPCRYLWSNAPPFAALPDTLSYYNSFPALRICPTLKLCPVIMYNLDSPIRVLPAYLELCLCTSCSGTVLCHRDLTGFRL